MIATDRDGAGVDHDALVVHDEVGGTRSDVNQANPEFTLVRLQHRVGASQRFKDSVVDVDTGAVHGRDHVLGRGGSRSHHMDPHLELSAH